MIRIVVMKISITRQFVLKGIAIIGMMALHFWGNPQWIAERNMYSGVFPNRIYEMTGQFGNICVSIFGFLPGYSFYIREDKWESGKYRLKKVIRFLAEYWVYMILFILIGLRCGEKCPPAVTLLYNVIGLETGAETEYVCVTFEWYVSFYLSVIFLYPLLKRILNCKLPVCLCILLIFYCFIEWIYTATLKGRMPIVAEFFRKENTLISVYMGYLFVRYSVLDKLVNIKSRLGKWGYYGIEAATIACLLILRCWNPDFMVNFWGIIYTLLVVVIVCVDMSDIENTKVGKLLHNLGKYSMGMWFISGLFFMPSRELQFVAYFLKYPVFILTWVIVITFIMSIFITKIIHFVESRGRLII